MPIMLTAQQQKDAAECAEMHKQYDNKDCLECSCNVCIADMQETALSNKEKAAQDMYEALQFAFNTILDGSVGQQIIALRLIKAALDKAEGDK